MFHFSLSVHRPGCRSFHSSTLGDCHTLTVTKYEQDYFNYSPHGAPICIEKGVIALTFEKFVKIEW